MCVEKQIFLKGVVTAFTLCLLADVACAASFDCAKAHSKLERAICADLRLSALDDELAGVYRDALALAFDRAALKKSQRDWLMKVRDLSTNPEEIGAAYLARIEEIRLDHRLKRPLFAGEVPPSSIFGRYSETEPLCFDPKEGEDEYDCSGNPVENYIEIKAGPGNEVIVTGELWFLNGHQCGPFEGRAEWVHDSLRMPNLEDEENRCVLIMRFRDNKVYTEDPGSFCRIPLMCGAINTGFHGIELPKLPDSGGGSAQGAKPNHKKGIKQLRPK